MARLPRYTMNQTQILLGGKTSALENSPVESIPVIADKKLSSTAQVVRDFSLLLTSAIDHIGLIGSIGLQKIRIPTSTKSARKGWRLTAKW